MLDFMSLTTWILAAVSVLGTGGAIAAFVFFPTIAAPILEKVVGVLLACKTCLVVGLLVAASLGSYWYGRHGEYDKGHKAAIAAIAAEDAAVLKDANEKRAVWKDCRARNGAWDQSTGECS